MYINTDEWNRNCLEWNKINDRFDINNSKSVVSFFKIAFAIRSNLMAAINLEKIEKKELTFFNQCLLKWIAQVEKEGYKITNPTQKLTSPIGKIIYSSSPRAKEKRVNLIFSEITYRHKQLLAPVSTVIFPIAEKFPTTHELHALPVHWRAILGEVELLTIHTRIQPYLQCAIESICKSKIVDASGMRNNIVEEIRRRKQILENSLKSGASNYSIASNYWRVEECFWSLFHADRPFGHSFFDIMVKRVQDWRGFLARKNKIMAKDFVKGKDSIAAINSYVEGIVLQKDPSLPTGKVTRELRSAIIVKENNTERILKGRVVCT